jgi:multiple sugar transport system permease protein
MAISTPTKTATSEATPRRRRRGNSFSGKDRMVLAGLVGVPTLLHILFVWIPAICTMLLSFTFWDGIGGLNNIHWAGLKNYQQIFTIYNDFKPALRNNVLWLAFFGLIATPLGILLAYYIDKGLKGTKFFQTAYYLPMVLSLAVTGIVWDYIFRTNGFVNSMLGDTNAQTAISWFGDPHKNIWVVLCIASWRQIGYVMLLYLAGMKSVDPSLHEAAAIDGATDWYTFRKVVFPSLRPVNVIIIVITVIDSLRAFDLVYIINRGQNGLQMLGVLVYNNILGEATRIGWGAALATILFALSIVPIMLYLYQTFKKEK